MSDAFIELKSSGRLPSPSTVGMKILQLTQQEDYSTEEVGATIQVDPALTGQILKIANSAQNASVQKVTTVGEATMRLGVAAVRNVALGFTLVSGNRAGDCQGFDYDDYWAESIVRAVAAQRLAVTQGKVKPEEAFICALLSDIGRLAFASVHPQRYSQLMLDAGGDHEALGRLEREAFHISAAEVTAAMLAGWGLPQAFSDAILEVEEFSDACAKRENATGSLLTLLWCASRVAEACVADPEGPVDWRQHCENLDRVQRYIGFGADELATVHTEILNEWNEWNASLGLPPRRAVHCSRMQELNRRSDGAPASTPSIVKPDGAPSDSPRGLLRVLVVDSDPDARAQLQTELQPLGHVVLTAQSGTDGLKMALDHSPHLILASDDLDELGGLELCKAMRRFEGGRKAFFIILTCALDDEKQAVELESGVDEHLYKPMNPRLLVARVKSAQRIINLQEDLEHEQETVQQQVRELGLMTRRLRAASLTDPLTELPNRRFAMKRLEQEWNGCERSGAPLSVITMDIDHFKSVNDTYGHDVGDLVLREVAGVLRKATRRGEQPARIGGEEFLVILRECGRDGAVKAAERIRAMIEAHVIQERGFDRNVTMSLGVATHAGNMPDVNALLKVSDEAVYAAKHGGRNRVCVGDDRGYVSTVREAG